MSLENFLKKEIVFVFLTNEDQMCLRRLMEHDTHEPGDLTASEAQGGVVHGALMWVLSTVQRLLDVEGKLVLHYLVDGHDEDVNWENMFRKAIIKDESKPNTEIFLSAAVGIKFLDTVVIVWEEILQQSVSRGSAIRFAIRWRHYSLRMWLKHRNNPQTEPELGIRFGDRFEPIAI